MWHYKDAKKVLIRTSVAMFRWEKAFSNTSVNETVAIATRTILSRLNDYIPHETIVCNDRGPLWFNDKIRLLIKEKTTPYRYLHETGNDAY